MVVFKTMRYCQQGYKQRRAPSQNWDSPGPLLAGRELFNVWFSPQMSRLPFFLWLKHGHELCTLHLRFNVEILLQSLR